MLKRRGLTLLGIYLLLFYFNAAAQETNIDSLIAAASLNTQKNALANYTYQLRIVRRSKREKFSWLYDAILPSRIPANHICKHSLILIEQNDKPVPYEILSNNRKSAVKELEESESDSNNVSQQRTDNTNQQSIDAQDDGGYLTINYTSDDKRRNFRVDLLTMLRISHFSNLKQETINGREAFVIEFAANDKAILPDTLSYFTKIRGFIWIDKEDKRIVQVEGFPLKTDPQEKAKNKPENDVVFFFSQLRTHEGFWFPQIIRLSFINHPELHNGSAYDMEYTFEKYQHLMVETTNNSQS